MIELGKRFGICETTITTMWMELFPNLKKTKAIFKLQTAAKAETFLAWMCLDAIVFFMLHNLAEALQTAGCIWCIFLRLFSLAFEEVLCVSLLKRFFMYDHNTIILRRVTKAKNYRLLRFHCFIPNVATNHLSLIWKSGFFKGALCRKTKVEGGWFKHFIPSRLCPRVDLGSR